MLKPLSSCILYFENYPFQIKHDSRNLLIDASEENNSFGRLINHSSRHANAKGERRVIENNVYVLIISTQQISAGEEVLFDYGRDYEGIPSCVLGCRHCKKE